jgi:hypothetical protein
MAVNDKTQLPVSLAETMGGTFLLFCSRFRRTLMLRRTAVVALFAFSPLAVHGAPPSERVSESVSFSDVVQGIWKDAGISTDAEYARLIRRNDSNASRTVAPRDLRALLKAWPRKRNMRCEPNQLRLHCENGRVALWWTGEIANAFPSGEAEATCDRGILALMYRAVTAADEREQLKRRTGLPARVLKQWGESPCYTRRVGETEFIVQRGPAFSYVGGDGSLRSGQHFHWVATRPYSGRQPTLNEVLAALPGWCRADWLDESVYEGLGTRPVIALANSRGTAVVFEGEHEETLKRLLESSGFDYDREHEPNRHGGVQKTWERYVDATFAHVTSYAEESRTRFSCQGPQLADKPRVGKAPWRHPSLRLPKSKRPVFKFDELNFATPELKQQTRILHELAQQTAGADWQVCGYRDGRYSNAPRMVSMWCTEPFPGTSIRTQHLPHHSYVIELTGPDSEPEKKDELNAAKLIARWVPKAGWGAWIQCQLTPERNEPLTQCRVSVGVVNPNNSHFSRDNYTKSPSILLLSHQLSVQHKGRLRAKYSVYLPRRTSLPPDEAPLYRRLLKLYESPESLRDVLLADVEQMRQLSREEIPTRKNVRVSDYGDYRLREPPSHRPSSAVSDETLQTLLKSMLTALDERETLIRENYREMHAALVKALPVDVLVSKE